MRWNWQNPHWPQFAYNPTDFSQLEIEFRENAGYLMGVMRHLSQKDLKNVSLQSLSNEAMDTSEIEGEFLDRASVQTSLQRHLGISPKTEVGPPPEEGVSHLMGDLISWPTRPLDEKRLFEWHGWLMAGRKDLRDIGRYRTSLDPMQVVSGSLSRPKVHFEAPPAPTLTAEMPRFWEWLKTSAQVTTQILVRASVAHLYFVCLHPFEDGNGRLGRALSYHCLLDSLGQPIPLLLSSTILEKRKDYYTEIGRAHV